MFVVGAACSGQPRLIAAPPGTAARGGVTLLSPRCERAESCVLGHVTAAESGSPMSHAAIFFQIEAAEATKKPGWILTLTDDQGVFEIENPPPGRYRLSVYAPPREIEMTGIELGAIGTTGLSVRLPPG